jgi:hypothetical protein
LALLAVVATGCGRAGPGTADPTPTYIPQPTPDPTMAAVIQGNGPPVSFLPPLETKGSPVAVPTSPSRPVQTASGGRPASKPVPTAREAAPPARESAPAPKPAAPTAVPPRPAPTAASAPRTSSGNGAAPASTGGGAPAIINPSTILPGSSVRPNPTPAR